MNAEARTPEMVGTIIVLRPDGPRGPVSGVMTPLDVLGTLGPLLRTSGLWGPEHRNTPILGVSGEGSNLSPLDLDPKWVRSGVN